MLLPLLRMHGLYDARHPPQDVLAALLVHPHLGDPADVGLIELMVRNAALHSPPPPHLWFERWATRSPSLASARRFVAKECRRLAVEAASARSSGLAGGHMGLPEKSALMTVTLRSVNEEGCMDCKYGAYL